MKLVEMEGSHVVQNVYTSLDIHLGQCLAVLVTADKEPKDYYMVASTVSPSRFLLGKASFVTPMAMPQHHLSSLRLPSDGPGLSTSSDPSAGTLQPVLPGLTPRVLTTMAPSTLPEP